jgi:hypothetical protein
MVNMDAINYIITAKHYAQREGASSVLERIKKLAAKINQRGGAQIQIKNEVRGFAVLAEIEFGQWIAHCECDGAEFVDPGEPIFFCFGCGNRSNSGDLRPVIFPQAREEIERLVLERPVNDLRGLDALDRAYQAKPMIMVEVSQTNSDQMGTSLLPLTRSWTPNETVEELREQNKAVWAWRESQKGSV